MKGPEQELIEVAYPYWEAEAEIVKKFFNNRPTKDDHIFWLKAQLWKELHPVDGYFSGLHRELTHLVDLFPRIDKEVSRHRYHHLLEQMTQEFNHYVLLADVLEYLLGRPLSADDTIQLLEEKKLGDIRRRYATSGSEIDKASVLVTEGGGARMFREGRKAKGGRLETMIAKAMDVIYQDEKNHFKDAVKEAAKIINTEKELVRMKNAIREISLQRVFMRYEMFRQPLTSEELKKHLKSHGADL